MGGPGRFLDRPVLIAIGAGAGLLLVAFVLGRFVLGPGAPTGILTAIILFWLLLGAFFYFKPPSLRDFWTELSRARIAGKARWEKQYDPGDGVRPPSLKVDEPKPRQAKEKILERVWATGSQDGPERSAGREFARGWLHRVELERNPGARGDQNAIAVMGAWTSRWGQSCRKRIGWLPRDGAAAIAESHPDAPLHASLQTVSLEDEATRVAIDVWI